MDRNTTRLSVCKLQKKAQQNGGGGRESKRMQVEFKYQISLVLQVSAAGVEKNHLWSMDVFDFILRQQLFPTCRQFSVIVCFYRAPQKGGNKKRIDHCELSTHCSKGCRQEGGKRTFLLRVHKVQGVHRLDAKLLGIGLGKLLGIVRPVEIIPSDAALAPCRWAWHNGIPARSHSSNPGGGGEQNRPKKGGHS